MLRKAITYITYPVLIAVMVLCLVAVAQAATGNIDAVDKWAWGTNVGWINFNPTHNQVTIDPDTGSFDGYAWGENVGWIHFKGTGVVVYNVVTDYRPSRPPSLPVGGVIVPVNELELVAPWMGVVALAGLAVLGAALVRRRKTSAK